MIKEYNVIYLVLIYSIFITGCSASKLLEKDKYHLALLQEVIETDEISSELTRYQDDYFDPMVYDYFPYFYESKNPGINFYNIDSISTDSIGVLSLATNKLISTTCENFNNLEDNDKVFKFSKIYLSDGNEYFFRLEVLTRINWTLN